MLIMRFLLLEYSDFLEKEGVIFKKRPLLTPILSFAQNSGSMQWAPPAGAPAAGKKILCYCISLSVLHYSWLVSKASIAAYNQVMLSAAMYGLQGQRFCY